MSVLALSPLPVAAVPVQAVPPGLPIAAAVLLGIGAVLAALIGSRLLRP